MRKPLAPSTHPAIDARSAWYWALTKAVSQPLKLLASQLKLAEDLWADYGQRRQTRREHLTELQSVGTVTKGYTTQSAPWREGQL